jgi:hypothetical protein
LLNETVLKTNQPPVFYFFIFFFLPAAEDGEMGAQLTSSIVRKILLW